MTMMLCVNETFAPASQLSNKLQESEREAMEKVSELEKKLIQTTKEVALLKVKNTHPYCDILVLIVHIFSSCLCFRRVYVNPALR